MTPTLTTDRLTLRPPKASDHAAYAAFFADPEASHFYGGPLLPYQAWERLSADVGHFALKGFGRFVIERDGAPVGGCGILDVAGWPGHELTWWLLPAARGQGNAQEASRAVLAWAGDALGWRQVETHFRDENLAARRLTESLGGVKQRREIFPDGHARDIYAIPTRAEVTA
ncbi:Protein N-acetyltransferase, RimJ/RimL family [Paracoccus isoporae]|uniref:Protein N-acetyltransferase, RimJ/RimL family n=1 Tax=Paracoccus isoporae TaxID=591205 RepID=A0A1G7BQ41_9RHOB|nr:GNAT family N-acetyltransferase [Paracoccus isoporae]SDE29083.1 Protein N-acetyltransferase, RimJ/RimL family [Paracoccus isoporae]